MMIIYSILTILLVLLIALVAFLSCCALLVNPRKEYTKENHFYRGLLNICTAFVLKLMRIKVHVTGIEKIPKNQKLLFVGNHRSNFDPIITWYVFREWLPAFVSKAANFKIPIFGQIVRRCCFMTIDRESPRKAIHTINHAAELLKEQVVSVGVYPEGTRSKNGELLPFHNGVFRIAQKANAPIAVVVLKGTERIHKNYPFRRSNIEMNIAEVIPAEQVYSMRSAELGDRVREIIENSLK